MKRGKKDLSNGGGGVMSLAIKWPENGRNRGDGGGGILGLGFLFVGERE